MPNEPTAIATGPERALNELAELRHFAGAPKDFWPRFLAAALQLTQADKLLLVARKPDQPWRRLAEWPADTPPSKMMAVFMARLDDFSGVVVRSGGTLSPLEARASAASGAYVIGARLELQQQEECVLAALVSETSEASAREALLRLRLSVQVPEAYQSNVAARQARIDIEKFASVLDLTASVSAEKRFVATAMAFCNGLATRFECDRVSLGWLDGGYIRLRVISHTEKFDRQMAAAQALEKAMEEALDQDEEVVWPAPEGAAVISRDHEGFAQQQKVGHVCSLPLRTEHKPTAVVTCERRSAPFTELELQQMRLGCDLAAPRLADLRQRDLWLGARLAAQARERLASWVGPEHTWVKLGGVLVCGLLIVLIFLKVPYRVEGNFTLRSDELTHLTAPFEGFIGQVLVRPGDRVVAGEPLVKLKTDELELEEAFASADVNRYRREAEKARAIRALADMRISESMADQAQARLDTVRFRLAYATIKSPFDGVVVEGDLREHLGAPVKAAEVLLKVARIDTLYVEAEVNERDVHELRERNSGQIAFVSQPRMKFPVQITTIEQAALPKPEANIFLVRCSVKRGAQSWWRPGMSGICKFDVEKRSLLWILTHRTVDFLRLKLWW